MSLMTGEVEGSRSRDRSPYKNINDEKTELIIRDLVKKRGIIKGRLTKFATYLTTVSATKLTTQCSIDLKLRIKGASNLFAEFNGIQSRIEESVPDSAIEEQLDQRQQFEDSYYSTLAHAESMLSTGNEVNTSSSSCLHTHQASIRLPTILLPTFDGLYEHWLEYRDTFLSLVHNSTELSDIQKFHYLKSSLKGSSELVISSVEISATNYNVAWELLLNRYDNTRLLVQSHVRALFSIEVLPKESSSLIRKLIDIILNNLRALKILGEPTEYWDTLIIYIVTSKLDKTTEREWEQHKSTLLLHSDRYSTLKVEQLIKFLKDRADLLETLALSHNKHTPNNLDYKKPILPAKSHTHCNVSSSSNKQTHRSTASYKPCPMCKDNHPLYTCHKFINTDLHTKFQVVNDNRLCNNCLRSGHSVEVCRFGPCRQCNKKHNSLLHTDVSHNATCSTIVPTTSHIESARSSTSLDASSHNEDRLCSGASAHNSRPHIQVNNVYTNTHTNEPMQPVLLSTALVDIRDRNNKYHVVRVLLDSGSQSSFITRSICELLNISLKQSTNEIRGVGSSVSHSTQTCEIEIKSRINTYSMRLKCFVLDEIMSTLPAVHIQRAQFSIPDYIQLANTQFFEPQKIDILIGADHFWNLLSDGRMRLINGPYLQNTKLGWIISGPINNNITNRSNKIILCNVSQTIDAQLRRNTYSDEARECERSCATTTTRDASGRSCVNIPLKESPTALGEPFNQAERRFYCLERRLLRAPPTYKHLYVEFMREYINLGHMTKIDKFPSPHYFMPHHGVFREHSTTTKLRVVFDASAVTSSGKSLNDIQMVGPPIQGDLLAILLRFRQFRYAAVADCEKMYRQVTVAPTQRNLQLVLWREEPSQPLAVYQLNTVTYGTASAPFLSVRCLKHLAAECHDPCVKRVINDDFYVDDLVTSCDDKHKFINMCKETKAVLQSGCFPLRKWAFNFKIDNQSIFTENETSLVDLNLGEQSLCKTLGLGWCNVTDTFSFNTQISIETTCVTKRFILSTVSQIFDPLGIVSPAVITCKIILQGLWLLKLQWDDPVPAEISNKFKSFVSNLSYLNSIRVPRHVFQTAASRTQLHIFTDASQSAYGACAYVRSECSGHVKVQLLLAKGKVAPLKPVTIPRLELCGALLGARLYDKIRSSLTREFNDAEVTFWTDSTIVLAWLRMSPSSLKTFVQNRVVEIHELSKDCSWRHVSGKENPADLISRGVNFADLSASNLWWEGPPFLRDFDHQSSINAQQCTLDKNFMLELPDIKLNAITSLLIKQPTNGFDNNLFPFSRFSQFNRMIRTAAYLLRFIHNMRNKSDRRVGELKVNELSNATRTLARLAQRESFPSEYNILTSGGNLQSRHRLSKLHLFVDSEHLLRVGGRIEASPDFDVNQKHPILLSTKHHFTLLLFRYEHIRLMHAGPQALLYSVRGEWWPLTGRNLARKVSHQCVVCTRMRGKTINPLMGNLPKERVSMSQPFVHVGVDYAGPVFILNRKGRGARLVKCYICLFVCFTTRAVHLELVSDLTTDAYLLALKRFISRRGKPSKIFSDNGRNFVGLMNDFAQFLNRCSSDVIEYASSQSIQFSLIPPYSPHFGGLWEAGVKACKYHLRRVVGNAHLTFEEFTTMLSQVEAILNSRPLMPLSSDCRDYLPLCPGHFLIGRPLTAPVYDHDLRNLPAHQLTRYQRIEQLRQHFWSRWAKEYISELQTRNKWRETTREIQAGTLVVIKEDNLPPLKWALGRILRSIPGKDGITRVAEIQTASGIIRRSYPKICPLWMDGEADEDVES